jgi:hypothetical protein
MQFTIAHLALWQKELASSIQEGPSCEADTFSADVEIPLIFLESGILIIVFTRASHVSLNRTIPL